jgi:hypothetical protein
MGRRNLGMVLVALGAISSIAAAPAGFTWKCNVDPLPQGAAFQIVPKLRATIEIKFPQTVATAESATPSPLLAVAVQNPQTESWRLLDLRTGKMTPCLSDQPNINNGLLSPDGKYLAGNTVFTGGELRIWPMVQNATPVIVQSGKEGAPTPLAFRGPKSAVLLCKELIAGKSTFIEFDPATGLETNRYALPIPLEDQGWAISPGGNYLAAVAHGPHGEPALFIVDLNARQVVGSAPVVSNQRSGFPGFIKAISFSADGSEVATLFEASDFRLIIFKFASGQVVTDLPKLKFDFDPADQQQSRPIQFTSDGGAVRIHQFIVDRTTGQITQTIPLPAGQGKGYTFVNMLSAEQALCIDQPPPLGTESHLQIVHVGD